MQRGRECGVPGTEDPCACGKLRGPERSDPRFMGRMGHGGAVVDPQGGRVHKESREQEPRSMGNQGMGLWVHGGSGR